MRSLLSTFVLCAATVVGQPAPRVSDKISPKLRALVQTEGQVPVFVVLNAQPHKEVLEHYENAIRVRMEEAETRSSRRQGRLDLEEGERELGAIRTELKQIRQTAFREITARIDPTQKRLEPLLSQLGARLIRRYSAVNMFAVELPTSAIETLAADPSVLQIVPVETLSVHLADSVPGLGAPAFWNFGYTGSGQSVAVMDTGVRTSHPAFTGTQIVSKVFLDHGSQDPCFANDSSTAEDKQGHGSHVAGIVASQGAPGWASYVGVAPGVSTLYNLKIGYLNCKSDGTSSTADMVAALEWAVQEVPELKVFNYSYGSLADSGDDFTAWLFDFFADAFDLTFSVSAGNEGETYLSGLFTKTEVVSSPGIARNVLAVAAMNTNGTPEREDDSVAAFSSRGPTLDGRKKPDIAAPGGFRDLWTGDIFGSTYRPDAGIYSVDFNSDGFVPKPGTSMAAPHIAGAAALLRSTGVLSPLAIKALLLNSADGAGYGWRPDTGWGYANLSTAWAQRKNVVLSSVNSTEEAGPVGYWTGPVDRLFSATLVWNRHFSADGMPYAQSLALNAYDRFRGTLIAASEDKNENVQQVGIIGTGQIVLKVKRTSPVLAGAIKQEPFALALSQEGFSPADGPVLKLTCSGPAQVAVGAGFTVNCTGTNTGDLSATTTAAGILLPGSSDIQEVKTLGELPPSKSLSVAWSVTAPTVPGNYTYTVGLGAAAYGEELGVGSSFQVIVSGQAKPNLTLQFTNHLVYPVKILTNGSQVGSVNGSGSGTFTIPAPSTLQVSFELVRPTLSGNALGEPMVGYYNAITNPSGSYSFTINNQIGTQIYFVPYVSNTSGSRLLMAVNGGLPSESRCNCVVPANGVNVAFGYYKLLSNSNVRAYRDSSGYTGGYYYFDNFETRVEAQTGILRLTFNKSP